ncbi:hypothetical protein LJR231_005241 [Phyllobacterium sp. LjRoot231]|uniref:hypothetical protein n=1 Tax=Phyllobacterium sp. LjRoot231 TaxID=3342289 RepID=UPI003ECC4F5D
MTQLSEAVEEILKAQRRTKKPLAIVLAGHNGSGKSTMWRQILSGQLQIPLINADRMMLSILPEAGSDGALDKWAQVARYRRGVDEGRSGWCPSLCGSRDAG